ncbi:MAG: phage antirepressor N-terminal domain-containing protein [Alphaproteobacteria bacterium]
MNGYELTTVDFHGATLVAIRGETDASTLVAMKSVVEGMGLTWERQREKLNAHPVLAPTIRGVPFPSAGGVQDTLCIPLSKLNFWLATIHPNKIRDEAIRAKVIEYQEECAEVLYQHFFAKAAKMERSRKQNEVRQMLVAQTRALNAAAGLMAEVRRSMGARTAAEAAPNILRKAGVVLSGGITPDPFLQGDIFDTTDDPNGRPN